MADIRIIPLSRLEPETATISVFHYMAPFDVSLTDRQSVDLLISQARLTTPPSQKILSEFLAKEGRETKGRNCSALKADEKVCLGILDLRGLHHDILEEEVNAYLKKCAPFFSGIEFGTFIELMLFTSQTMHYGPCPTGGIIALGNRAQDRALSVIPAKDREISHTMDFLGKEPQYGKNQRIPGERSFLVRLDRPK